MTWTVGTAAAGEATITRWFRVQPFSKTYAVLWEDLRPGGAEWERRAVTLEKLGSDVNILKSVTPKTAPPGAQIAYTLSFSNAGSGTATGVIITDRIPAGVMQIGFDNSGATITQTAATLDCIWQVSDLVNGEGGMITITGTLSRTLAQGAIIINTAGITTTSARDGELGNNFTSV